MPFLPDTARDAAPRRHSIRRQITTLGLALTALVLAVFGLGMVVHEAVNRREALAASMTTDAEIIGRNSSAAVAFRSEAEANEILASLAASPDVRQALILLPDGTVLGQYHSAVLTDGGCHELRQAVAHRRAAWDLRWCGAAIRRPILLHDREIGMLAMEVDLGSTYRALAGTVTVGLLIAAAVFGLSVPLWRRVATRLTEPLTRLGQITERVSREQDFSLRAAAGGSLEVDTLAAGFNQMMSQLQQRDASLSHELNQRRHAELRLNDLAYFDGVTGLHNRHYFRERLVAAVARADREQGRCAIVYIDLDGFKQVNDTLGHDRGDELLREVGRRLTDTLRRSDGVCRLGGDEFAVIVDDDSPAPQVQAIAAKLVAVLSEPYRVGGLDAPRVSASIGACVYPDAADGADALMRLADAAMYRAKARGKNGYWIHGFEGEEPASREQRIERALPHALSRGELHLAFQPQVALDEAAMSAGPDVGPRVVGFEVLLRWRHESLGAVLPTEFIPIAEADGRIEEIGEWVLRESCARLVEWRAAHRGHASMAEPGGLKLSVNVSARQLVTDSAIDRMAAVLAESGLPAGAIELELTETLLVDRSAAMLARLRRLRAAGFRLAIDDFGTGYSSLAYLDSFPITTLKIDRAFVSRLGRGSQGDAIARAILAIGAALEVDVIAEGIETVAQAQLLRAWGCHRAQGVLYGVPMSEDEVRRCLRAETDGVPVAD